MKKNKAKKKVKKKAKRKVTSKPRKPTTKRTIPKQSKITLREKIARIRDRVPHIEPGGECIDPETKEVLFRYTEAQNVFEIYRAECQAEGLIYRPYFAVGIQPVIAVIGRGLFLAAPFCIEDIKTGEILVGWGSGMGSNGDWSGNTAATRALKQFLLTTFQATWKDPEHETKSQLRAEVRQELEDSGVMTKITELGQYFTNYQKEKPHDTKKPNPKRSVRRSSKKN